MDRGLRVLFAVLLGASQALAQSAPGTLAETLTGDAKGDYEAAKLLFADGDYPAAELKFSAAHDKSKDPRLLWDVAACEKAQHHYARAVTLVRAYLTEGGALLADADRAEGERLLATLATLTGKIGVNVDQAGAEVSIDGTLLGTSPLPPLLVDFGAHRIHVTKPGFEPVDREVTVVEPRDADVAVALKPIVVEAGPAPAYHAPAVTRSPSVVRPVGIGIASAGMVALGVGIGFAVDAASKWSDARSLCSAANGCLARSPAYAARGAAWTSADWATGLTIVGAVAAAAGIVMAIVAPRSRRTVSVEVGSGVWIGGTF